MPAVLQAAVHVSWDHRWTARNATLHSICTAESLGGKLPLHIVYVHAIAHSNKWLQNEYWTINSVSFSCHISCVIFLNLRHIVSLSYSPIGTCTAVPLNWFYYLSKQNMFWASSCDIMGDPKIYEPFIFLKLDFCKFLYISPHTW